MLALTRLEDRATPLAFEVLFAADPWLTTDRRQSILAAIDRWAAVCADRYVPLDRTDYTAYDHAGRTLTASPPPVPADTLRVWVGAGPTFTPSAAAEAGRAGYIAQGDPLPRFPGWVVTFNPARVTDADLPAVALHEAGHVVGQDHEAADTPADWRTAMFPYVDATRTALTPLDARRLIDGGHRLAPGTLLQTGTTPDGWMVYDPHGLTA